MTHTFTQARLRRFASIVSALSLVAYSSTMLTPGLSALAQTPVNDNSSRSDKSDDRTETPERSKQDEVARKKKEMPPPAGNPTVIIDPNTGSGNNTRDYNKDGTVRPTYKPRRDYGDHKPHPNDPRNITPDQDLPYYGYSYFEPARQFIEARRNGLRRMMLNGTDSSTYGRGSRNRNSQDNYGTSTTRKRSTRNTDNSDNSDNSDDTTPRSSRKRNSDDTDNSDSTSTRSSRSSRNADNSDDNSDNSDTSSSRRSNRNADNSDNSDDNSDNNSNTTRRRSTRADNSDDNSDNSDTSSSRRSNRNADNSDNSDDNSDNSDNSSDTQTRDQQRRKLQGLPARSSTNRNSRRSSDDTSEDSSYDTAYNTGRSSRYSNRNAIPDYTTAPYSSLGPDGNLSGPRSADAFSEIADPLTQLTRNVTASAPTNYQLSGGDELVIHISSPKLAPRDIRRTVDAQGNLDLDDLGRYVVRGKNLDQLQRELQSQIGRFYRNANVDVSFRQLRTIPVTVQGEAVLPGTYVVPAVMTAFNVLYAAGGPTEDGSLREIKIIRQGREIGTLDFYKFIAGKSQADIGLQAGDVISIPPAGARVALTGEIRHPAFYEIKDHETLQDALTYSGGVKASGLDQLVQINTLIPGQSRVLKNVNLHDKAQVAALPLYDGDSVEIHSLRPIVENKVTVTGAVTQPGDYALTPGMKVSDLLRLARNPLNEAYLGRAALQRWNSDGTTTMIPIDLSKAVEGDKTSDVALMKWDTLQIYSRQEAAFVGTRRVQVRGAIQRAGTYEYSQNMRLSDILLRAGGPLPDAETVAVLHQHGDGTYKWEYASVADVAHGDPAKDLLLEDNDLVAVYKNNEAQFIAQHQVRIDGNVNTPGFYPRGEGMRLSDLLKLSGGFMPGASPKVTIAHARRSLDNGDASAKIVSVMFNENHQCAPQDDVRLEDGDVVAVQGTGGLQERPAVVTVRGAVNQPGPIILEGKTVRLSEIIKKAGGLRPEAFPEGAEFNRDPKNLSSKTQQELATKISELNNLLNDSAYKRELAKSDVDRIKAASSATDSSSPVGGGQNGAGNAAATTIAGELAKHELVTKPRILGDNELLPNGNVAVDLPEAMHHPGGVDDILVMDGDSIAIPEQPTTIMVVGAVVHQRGVLYSPGKSLDYYVAQAGGYAADAVKERIEVIHAGGGLIPGKQVKQLRPGDMIVVPNKPMAEHISQNRGGIDSFFRSITNSAIMFRLATGIFGL